MTVHVGFVVEKVAHGQILLRLLWFTAINFYPTKTLYLFVLSFGVGQ
jgi:hypothetical protein